MSSTKQQPHPVKALLMYKVDQSMSREALFKEEEDLRVQVTIALKSE
jgi:hypothetical protein